MRVHPEGEQLVVSDLLANLKPLVLQSVTFQRVELRDTVNGLEVRDPFDVRGDRWWSLHELLKLAGDLQAATVENPVPLSEDLDPLSASKEYEHGLREVAPGQWCGLHGPQLFPVCEEFNALEENQYCITCAHHKGCHAPAKVRDPVEDFEEGARIVRDQPDRPPVVGPEFAAALREQGCEVPDLPAGIGAGEEE